MTASPTAQPLSLPQPASEEHEIIYVPGPAATRFHHSTARVKLAWGPVRTGKSTSACWEIFNKAMECAAKGFGLRALILRDTYRNLEDTTVKTWMEWFRHCGTRKIRQSVTDFHLYTPGSDIQHEILFRHGQTASDASSFLSSEYGVIFLEEAAPAFMPSGLVSPGISEEVFDIATTRLIQSGVDEPELLITCNPPTPQHWVNRRIIAEEPNALRDRNWWHFFFSQEENKEHLREGYYEELEKNLADKPHLLRRFVMGEVVSVYPGMPVFARDFSQSVHVRNELHAVPNAEIFFGFDAGESLTPAAVWLQIDAMGRILVLHELQAGYMGEMLSESIGTKEFAQQIKMITATKFPQCKPGTVYIDPAAFHRQPNDTKTVADILVAEGFVVEASAIDITSRVESIRERLQRNIGGEPGILIDRSGCPLLIEGMSGGYRYRTTNDATRLVGSTVVKDVYSNPMDALGYALAKVVPVGQFTHLGGRVKPPVKKDWSVFHSRRSR